MAQKLKRDKLHTLLSMKNNSVSETIKRYMAHLPANLSVYLRSMLSRPLPHVKFALTVL